MTYKVCYWDEVEKAQKERDATPEEAAEIESLKAAGAAVSQFDRDKARYQKRASVRDELIAYMAADNMGRVRSGVWTVPQLISLMDDPAVAAATAYMGTLSFELAAQAINSAATPLLTPGIRADWIAKLQAHFYLAE